jgi:hypothetical protein
VLLDRQRVYQTSFYCVDVAFSLVYWLHFLGGNGCVFTGEMEANLFLNNSYLIDI